MILSFETLAFSFTWMYSFVLERVDELRTSMHRA
jgi:hypothetical protein